MEMKTILFGWMILQVGTIQSEASHALITPKICPLPAVKLIGIMFRNKYWPANFHSQRCRQMVSKLTSVISPSES